MVELTISIKLFMFIVSLVIFLLIFNILLRNIIEKYTQFNGVDIAYYNWKFVILYILIGFTFLIFKKRVREYRKYHFIKGSLSRMEWQKKAFPNGSLYDKKRYVAYKRYLQLKKLQKKIKWSFNC